MIRMRRITRTQMLDTRIALTWQIDYCLENARGEHSPWIIRGWCLEAARYVSAYRAILHAAWPRLRSDEHTDTWSQEITMLLMCAEGKQEWNKATPDSTP